MVFGVETGSSKGKKTDQDRICGRVVIVSIFYSYYHVRMFIKLLFTIRSWSMSFWVPGDMT